MQRKGYDVGGIIDWAAKNWQDLAKVGGAAAKSYIDYQDQKRRNEVEQAAYNEYLKQVEAAGQEAQAAVDLNLMPMTITNVPTTKADVSDFTAVAARGGLMNLPTRQRKRYASQGFVEDDDIEIMEPESESLGDFELRQEEGVNIGEQVFHDTGDPMTNAKNVWNSGQINQDDYIDFNEFFQSGDWQDHISKVEVEGDMQMASAPSIDDDRNQLANKLFPGKNLKDLTETEVIQLDEFISQQMASGGIAGLRHGGRPGYKDSNIEEFQITESVEAPEGYYDISTRDELNPNEMLSEREDFWNEKFTPERGEHVQKFDKQRQEVYELAKDIMGGLYGPEKISFTEAVKKAEEILLADSDWIIKEGKQKRIKYPFFHEQEEPGTNRYDYLDEKAKGGRIRKDNGGIMNLGGLEKDYRTTGGFVPIGAYERKDDVPARLSKNEFVMTADAVRAAGGGSINKGAQRMYDTMKHLEAQPQAKRMTA